MKISRVSWAVVAIVAAGLALFLYSQTREKPRAHSVTLRWSSTPYTTSYNVYRATVSGGPYRKIGSSPEPYYVDTGVPSGAVFYYVVTADRKGKESGYSREIKAIVP